MMDAAITRPPVKINATILFLFSVLMSVLISFSLDGFDIFLYTSATLAVLEFIIFKIAITHFLRRATVLVPFLALYLFTGIFNHYFPLFVFIRALLAMSFMLIFASVISFNDFIGVLKTLHFPDFLINTLYFFYFFIQHTREALERSVLSVRARTISTNKIAVWLGYASNIGKIFVFSLERGERIGYSIRARGGLSGQHISADNPKAGQILLFSILALILVWLRFAQ